MTISRKSNYRITGIKPSLARSSITRDLRDGKLNKLSETLRRMVGGVGGGEEEARASYGNSRRRLIDRAPQKLIRPGMPALYILGAVYDPTEGKFTVSTLPVLPKPETTTCPPAPPHRPVVLSALSIPAAPLSFDRERKRCTSR